MLCAVYRSLRKEGTYLYIEKRDDFSKVPDLLLQNFGSPQLVTILNLAKREHLAQIDINKLKAALVEQGFYLQLPPPPENLLAAHKAATQLGQ
ncbi:YcgL domain-containing protein [Alishewanella tabrizica]|uniref:YcgL domain-containing protein GCM10008111_02370 n=1 Tax=Alishewanella tabrizica TaxID=671278 RepID=A0ABQ2WCS9_9ALTE|nr:YcgL domain-containing protein [Alishewanella tabrizica]GGW50068.1 YcgL domain-containing protein [Alishewanella tabrizica]